MATELEVPIWCCASCATEWVAEVMTRCPWPCGSTGERTEQLVRRTTVSRLSLRMSDPQGLRAEPLLLVERMADDELERVREAVTREIQRRHRAAVRAESHG